jgi:hypothetical protein
MTVYTKIFTGPALADFIHKIDIITNDHSSSTNQIAELIRGLHTHNADGEVDLF